MLSICRSLAVSIFAASLASALAVASPQILPRQTVDPAQDSRSCLSIRDVCDPRTIPAADASNAVNTHPACIALIVCEGPTYFEPDFPANQPRLTREAFNAVSKGSDVITQQQFIDFYYGTIASINATLASSNVTDPWYIPEYPSSAQAVIGWWEAVVAWTGFCDTSAVPYQNFADWIEYSTQPGVCPAVQSCTPIQGARPIICVPQEITDNGSCAEMFRQCSVGAGDASSIFSSRYCVLTAFCYSQSTIDTLIEQLHQEDYLSPNAPVLSANQPRLSQSVFNAISSGNSVVSQQNVIDAYYGALTNTIQSCGGPPGAETSCSTGTSGPYPTDASYVIDFWEKVSAWTGFCGTREVPYGNLADYLQFSSSSPNYLGIDFTQKLTKESLDFLIETGINRIISLNQFPYTEEEQASLEAAGITYLHLPVEDFHPPTVEQLSKAFEFYKAPPDGATTLVHCGAGYGRSGTCVSAIQLFVTSGKAPEEGAWKAENFVEKEEQVAVLREIRDLCLKENHS
ncbi:hypothetical protein CVT26_001953 [Gymnopilus dilepis]|uniref:Tyrosine specific protein phosphatases domain-containing protein n=1 Tax=Gymnopilus dilepis TaxID=231916 RepID=A0A409WE92_9AGAR|nr:hypothetical protein CVT26_001953 [Gymnopilus dilepis]